MSEKEAYQQKVQSQLDQLSADIDKLKAQADEAGADAKVKYHKKIDELRSKQQTVKEKLDELDDASEQAWNDLKSGIDNAMDTLGNSIKAASSHFK